MVMILKCQQFKDSESDKTESKILKCQRMDDCDNEEGNGLDKYEDEIESANIFPFPLVLFFFFPKGVKPLVRSRQGKNKPKPSCIHPKSLLLREMLTSHQSS